MISYEYTLTNRDGLSVVLNDMSTDPDNFVALQEYPVFDVDVKGKDIDKEGQHGVWDFFSFYGKRAISFTGVIVGETEADVERLKKLILQVTALPAQPSTTRDGLVLVEWTDAAGDEWQIYAKLDRAIRFERPMKSPLKLGFVLTMKAPDPTIESQTIIVDNGVRGWQTGSFIVPAELPLTIDLVYENTLIVSNDGNTDAHTIIRIYGGSGGITNPEIKNLTTGKSFKVNTTIASVSDYIEIDSKNGTVVDQDGVDLSGDVDSASDFILLLVGDNELVFLSDESSGVTSPVTTFTEPTEVFDVSHRDPIL